MKNRVSLSLKQYPESWLSTALPMVFVAGLQNGTTTKVDLVAGYEEENNACTGQAFNFKGDHYWKHKLYTGQQQDKDGGEDERGNRISESKPRWRTAWPGWRSRPAAGARPCGGREYGTVVLVSDVVRKKERCRRATELFTAVREFHPRQEDPAEGVLFNPEEEERNHLGGDGSIKVRENACQMNRAAKWNTRTALVSADNSQLANIILGGMASYAGAAFSVVMGTTVRVNFMNYRPTADTDGIYCEIPVTFLDRMKNRVCFHESNIPSLG